MLLSLLAARGSCFRCSAVLAGLAAALAVSSARIFGQVRLVACAMVDYIGYDNSARATASRTIVGRSVCLWCYGGARCPHLLSASRMFGLIADVRCPLRVLELCGGVGCTHTNTAEHQIWPRELQGLRIAWKVRQSARATRLYIQNGTLGARDEPFRSYVYVSLSP